MDQSASRCELLCSSSGGNAGYAVATAGLKLNIPVDVFVPITTLPMMIEKLKESKANVTVGGNNWNEADQLAQECLLRIENSQYIPPFDDPLIWEGNSSIVDELQDDMESPPDAVVVSVGGGGLLRGIQLGAAKHNWDNTKILALETEGAASFAAAKRAGTVVKLNAINTIASTLGALAVVPSVLDNRVPTNSIVVSDKQAVSACLEFASQFRQLVEPSCGATLALLYDQHLSQTYLQNFRSVVFVVCGGSAVSMDLLNMWKTKFGI